VLYGQQGAPRALQWLLRRNGSMAPRHRIGLYLSLGALLLLVTIFLQISDATRVLAFATIEGLLVGVALLVMARHAGDHEMLTLVGGSLQVQQRCGSRVARTEFAADRMTVEPAAGQGSLVELCGRGHTIRVGRFLRPELRAAFARELRLALRQAAATRHAPEIDTN
jgi:uncharacterized membrane protein